MLKHRCPWCGETIPFRDTFTNVFRKYKEPDICPACKEYYKSYPKFLGFLVALFFVFPIGNFCGSVAVLLRYGKFSVNLPISFLFTLLFTIIIFRFLRTPLKRKTEKGESPIAPKFAAIAALSWESHKKEGLRLPRFQVLDGEIFPACFMDKDGVPISTALCVVLEENHWMGGRHSRSKISFVLDDAPEEKLLRNGNRFYLYYDYRKIAEGLILSSLAPINNKR